MKSRATLRVGAALVVLPGAIPAGFAQPATVYVVNDTWRDPTDQDLLGLVWQRMGFLEKNGRPARIVGEDLVFQDNSKVGKVIENQGGVVIGWKTLDGKTEAYDLNATTFATPWERVAAKGTLDILKHGLSPNFDKETKRVRYTEGSALHLDQGKFYDGFTIKPPDGQQAGKGTGRSADQPAYQLPAREGADLNVILSVCFARAKAEDRRDENDVKTLPSVEDTIKAIPGVKTVKATRQAVTAGKSIQVGTAENASSHTDGALLIIYFDQVSRRDPKVPLEDDDLTSDPPKAFQKAKNYLDGLRLKDRWARVRAAADTIEAGDETGKLKLDVKVKYFEPEFPEGAQIVLPLQPTILDSSANEYLYDDGLTGEPTPAISAAAGAIQGEAEVQVRYQADFIAEPLAGADAASSPALFVVTPLDDSEIVGDLTFTLPFTTDQKYPALYRLVGSQWVRVNDAIIDQERGIAQWQARAGALYQVFGALCAPDFNGDRVVDAFDYDDFVSALFAYAGGGGAGGGVPDYNRDGAVDSFDYDDFVSDFFTGCG